MPLYEYRCKNCGHQFEKIQSFSAPEEKECPACKGPVERLLSAPAVQFKGSGWYVTDYASKSGGMKASAEGNGKPAESASTAGESGSGGKSEKAAAPSSGSDSASSKSSNPSPAKSD